MIAHQRHDTTARQQTGSAAPGFDFGGTGTPLHFLHANGYPPACYRPLMEQLSADHHVFGMLLRPLWPDSDPLSIRDWIPLSDDLRRFLHETGTGPVIGVGHSIGGVVTLRAALQEPGLFRCLVLIDPVLVPVSHILGLRIMRAVGLPTRLRVRIEAALRRRRRFDSREQLFAGYRHRPVFRFFSDEALRALVEGITRPSADGGYELVYSPEWEARIYETGIWNDWDIWDGLRSLKVPTMIIRGADTDTFFQQTARLVARRNPAIRTMTIPQATHLVPMERPAEAAAILENFVGTLERLDVRTG